MTEGLFIDNIHPSDDLYIVIRDEDRCIEYKHYLENLWKIYYPYADKDFPQQLARDFHARFWEMYLTCTLLNNSFQVVPKQRRSKGPDILIDDSIKRIFIEAVTPSRGAGTNPDRVTPLPYGKARTIPNTEIILRYSSAIADKYKKYIDYLEDGLVSTSDSYIIALNSCKIGIEAKGESSGLPRIVKAVLPVGDKVVTISEFSGPIVPWRYQYRPVIQRSRGGSVPSDLFLSDEYKGLSGILYAHSDVANRPNQAGEEFIFIHNPKTKQNPVPHDYFKLGIEYYVELDEDAFSISWKDWRNIS